MPVQKLKSRGINMNLVGFNYTLIDLFTQILSGLDSEYTPIVVTLNKKDSFTWIEC